MHNENKHTPGPWHYSGFAHEDWRIVGGLAMRETIAVMPRHPDESRYMRDARLIAAAPEMLAALMLARNVMGSALSPTRHDIGRLDAIIAKAKGEEPYA